MTDWIFAPDSAQMAEAAVLISPRGGWAGWGIYTQPIANWSD